MAEVTVQDKLAPFIQCPPNVIVSCDFWFDAQETNGFVPLEDDVLTPVFGRILDAFDYDQSDREPININDPGRPTNPGHPDYLAQPHNWGLEGWADDNCDVEIDVRVRLFDDCSGEDFPVAPPHANAVRLVERTFRARDAQGNSSTCVQRVWVVDFKPFYISDQTCANTDPNDGVIWPCDKEYTTCPDVIPVDYPVIFDDNCSLVGVTFKDKRFDFVEIACYKILREWAIIDWCHYNPVSGAGYWKHTQIIKVLDNQPATFLDCPAAPLTLCVDDPNVTLPVSNQVFTGEGNPGSSSCSVHVRLEHTVYETCSDWVEYDVKVYPNNGPTFIQVVNKTKVTLNAENEGVLVFDTKTSANGTVRNFGLPYNDRYCLGTGGPKDYHRILWSVEDGCGNLNTCEYLLRLEDCKKPSPVCVGLSSVVMPSSGDVTLWAVDFNASGFDDCTPAANLLYSFSGVSYQPSRSFDCAAIDANGSPSFVIEVWVADEGNDDDCNGVISWGERNKDYCTTFVVIGDNQQVCSAGGTSGVIGSVRTEIHEPVENVEVDLTSGVGIVMQTVLTTKDGKYTFPAPVLDYRMHATRNDNHRNGVSTLDLVKIQKHLLGIEALNSPYKLIAADANGSQTVTAIDLIELRKLVLGIYNELPHSESWRFVDAQFSFADPNNPWPYEEVIALDPEVMNYRDLIGIKVGDVNASVVANAGQVEVRSARAVLALQTSEQTVTAGQEVVVTMQTPDLINLQGFQFTLLCPDLQFNTVQPGSLDLGPEHIGIHKSAITASWHTVRPASPGRSEVLYTLRFTAKRSGLLSDMLSVSSQITPAEAYDSGDEILDVHLVVGDVFVTRDEPQYQLFQNNPNPFTDQTLVSFSLPEEMPASLTVFDATGKIVYRQTGAYSAGQNEIILTKREVGATGMYYYRLDAGSFTATKKMVFLE